MTVSIQSAANPHVGPLETNRRDNASWKLPLKQSIGLKRCALSLNRRMRAKAPRTLCDSAASGLRLPPIRTLDTENRKSDRQPEPLNEAKSACPASPHGGRRQEVSLVQRKVRFQQVRHHLWRQGPKALGNLDHQDMVAFVVARRLQQPSCAPSSAKGGNVGADQGGRRPVQVVIQPQHGVPISLSREFDLDRLRATIADPLPFPPSPHLDLKALLAAAVQTSLTCEGASTCEKTPTCEKASPCEETSTLQKDSRSNGPVPIHLDYARASLPILASILMSSKVSHGDRIYLPMPHPGVWTETAAYIYTGRGELLTEQVRQNVLYLGGKV